MRPRCPTRSNTITTAAGRGSKVVLELLEMHGICELKEQCMRTARPHLYLGLDVSTTSTGFAVVNETGALQDYGLIDQPPKQQEKKCLLDIAQSIESKLYDLSSSNIDDQVSWTIGIEEFMKTYYTGRFHTQGLFQLARLNGIVSYSCFRAFQTKPIHIHPTTARAAFQLTTPKANAAGTTGGTTPSSIKQVVLDYTRCQYPSIESHDVADAFIVARYVWLQSWIQSIVSSTSTTLKQDFVSSYKLKHKKRLQTRFQDDSEQQTAYLEQVYANGVEEWMRRQPFAHTGV